MGVRERLMEHPRIYAAWQAPFAAQKFAPVERWLRNHKVHRVLDVGCGAGTNAAHFTGVDYTGIDVNERYLQVAGAKFRGRFVQADLTASDLSSLVHPLNVSRFQTLFVESVPEAYDCTNPLVRLV